MPNDRSRHDFSAGCRESWSVKEALDKLTSMITVPVSVEYDASRARAGEITNLCCNSGRLRSTDVLSFWRMRLADTEGQAPGINGR
jgi:hypothetical protein